MEFKNIVINSLIIGLAVISLLLFAGQYAVDNNLNQSILSGGANSATGQLNSSLSSQLQTYNSQANTSKQGYQTETNNPGVTALGFYFRSIIDAGTTFFGMTFGIMNSMVLFVDQQFNIPPIVTGTLFTIITVLILLGVWSMLRAGR